MTLCSMFFESQEFGIMLEGRYSMKVSGQPICIDHQIPLYKIKGRQLHHEVDVDRWLLCHRKTHCG